MGTEGGRQDFYHLAFCDLYPTQTLPMGILSWNVPIRNTFLIFCLELPNTSHKSYCFLWNKGRSAGCSHCFLRLPFLSLTVALPISPKPGMETEQQMKHHTDWREAYKMIQEGRHGDIQACLEGDTITKHHFRGMRWVLGCNWPFKTFNYIWKQAEEMACLSTSRPWDELEPSPFP